jgi:prepilin-type N-terminal cleavage/methylation domain-containing protein
MRTKAFTLAEVLITLGIIGVVAALTIPTLISNTNSQRFRALFKKSLSTLDQAGRMAQAKYEVNYGAAISPCGENAQTENLEDTYSFCAILNGTLSGATYIGTPQDYQIQMYDFDYTPQDMIAYTMSDGTMVMFNKLAMGCSASFMADATWSENHPQCLGFIDVNGKTRPNKLVSCNNPDFNTNGATTCSVASDNQHMTDVYPVIFHDGSVDPASAAARAVLSSSNNDEATEAGGVLSAPPKLCSIKVAGCSPCDSCYNKGFEEAQIRDKIYGEEASLERLN